MRNPLRHRTAAPALALLALLLAPPARSAYLPLEQLPVESPAYRLAGDLVASWGAPAGFLSTQPWDRAELGVFLDRLAAWAPQAVDDPAFLRLALERAPAAARGGWPAAVAMSDSAQALEISPYARADYADDRSRHAVSRDFRAGVRASWSPGAGLLGATDLYAGTTSPGPHGNPVQSRHFGLIEGVQLNSYYDRAYAVWSGRLGRLTAGHTWLRWGPGAWGTMALSDGAPAFDVVEVRAPALGRAQLAWFVALLDPATSRYLAGHRLELRPSARWDVSFAELARFDGSANLPLYALPLVPYSLVEKRILKSSDVPSDSLNTLGKNNVMWTLDGAWRAAPGLRLYGELAIDDVSFSSEKRPRAIAWQAGGQARHVRGTDAWTARAEYSRVYQYTYSVFHHHDFEFAGFPTGFPLGPDVERLNGRLEFRRGPAWTFALEGALTRKGEGALGEFYVPGSGPVNNLPLSGVVDEDTRGALSADWSPAPGLQLGASVGAAHARAPGHVAGATASGAWGATRMTVGW